MSELSTETRTGLVTELARYVNGKAGDAYLTQCVTEAVELVGTLVARSTVPDAVLNRARIEVAAELFHRKQARSGVAQFDGGPESGPEIVRIGNDPLRAVRPMLRPYLKGGFA